MSSTRGPVRGLVARVLRGREGGVRDRLRACVRRWDGDQPIAGSGRPAPVQPDLGAPSVAEAAGPEAPAGAPAGFAYAVDAAALAPGEVAEVMVGDEPVALANVGGRFYAVTDICPHAGGPLGDGQLDGTTLTCPFHGWSFDVTTGACHVDPTLSLETFAVRIEGGRVFVGPASRPAPD